jgi:hypothetical protein
MDSTRPRSRRSLLEGGSLLALVVLAGCTGDENGSEDTETGTPSDGMGSDPEPNETDSDDEDALALREANVVDVALEPQDEGYHFDVTLHHDDDGEEGYADWWQLERIDGTRLGRRELRHAHSQQPFTRAKTIDVSADVDRVVVRGHDQTHGYGGTASVVRLESKEFRLLEQGSEKQSFAADDCP